MALGVAREVKLAEAGCQLPSAARQAHCGQWQKPLLYLPSRSHKSSRITDPCNPHNTLRAFGALVKTLQTGNKCSS